MFPGFAVNHPVSVRVVERARHRCRDPHSLIRRELALAPQPATQRLPFDVGHHVEEEAFGFPRVEERQEMRVLQVGRELDLSEESLPAQHSPQLRAEHLECDLSVVAKMWRRSRARYTIAMPPSPISFSTA
jgi:hypothetical protein